MNGTVCVLVAAAHRRAKLEITDKRQAIKDAAEAEAKRLKEEAERKKKEERKRKERAKLLAEMDDEEAAQELTTGKRQRKSKYAHLGV